MASYAATVERDGRFWLVTVDGVGVTQARRLGELETMTVELIALMTGDRAPQVAYDLRLPDDVAKHVAAAEDLRHRATQAQSDAATEMRLAATELHAQGIPLRDVGRLLGISFQRAHQLVTAA